MPQWLSVGGAPTLLGRYITGGLQYGTLAVLGNFAYTLGWSELNQDVDLQILNIENSRNPFLLSTFHLGALGREDMVAGNDSVYLAGMGVLVIIDVSDKYKPHVVSSYDTQQRKSSRLALSKRLIFLQGLSF